MIPEPYTNKYLIKATLKAEGIVEQPDVVGAIFGQTEGLLGNKLDLRDLQKGGRIGRIDVDVSNQHGKSIAKILLPSNLDRVETAILAAAINSIDRVGPCKTTVILETVEDVRMEKRTNLVSKAKSILSQMDKSSTIISEDIIEEVRQSIRMEELGSYGRDKCPCGPNIENSDAIIVVEGRSDVLNLLKYGVRNVVAVEGADIPKTIMDLSKKKNTTAFFDGDRGGMLVLKELLNVAEVDFIAFTPENMEVEELTQKQVMKALSGKLPVEQIQDFLQDELSISREPRKTKLIRNIKANNFGYCKSILEELSGTLKAKLLDKDLKEIKEIAVRDIVDEIKKTEKARTILFDGVITQRLVDTASQFNIKNIIGVKMGNVVRKPEGLNILTKDDL